RAWLRRTQGARYADRAAAQAHHAPPLRAFVGRPEAACGAGAAVAGAGANLVARRTRRGAGRGRARRVVCAYRGVCTGRRHGLVYHPRAVATAGRGRAPAGFAAMLSVFAGVLRRDLRLVLRQRGALVHHLLFAILVVVLFPLGTAADSGMLVTISPALLWIAVLLASLLSLQRLFRPDCEDGTLEQFLLSPEPLAIIALGRVTAQWLSGGLVFVLISPLLAVLL